MTNSVNKNLINTSDINLTSATAVDRLVVTSNLDWEVVKQPLFYTFNGQTSQSDQNALLKVTQDGEVTPLTTCRDNWQHINPKEFIQYVVSAFNDLNESGVLQTNKDLTLAYLGAVKNGQYIHAVSNHIVTADVSDTKVGDLMSFSIQIICSNVYGKGHQINIITNRLACENGMILPSKQFNIINHKSQTCLSSLIQAAVAKIDDHIQNMNNMTIAKLTEEEAMLLLIQRFGNTKLPFNKQPKIVQLAHQLFCNELREEQKEGVFYASTYNTVFRLLNCVTEYYTHHHNYRKTSNQLHELSTGIKAQTISQFYTDLSKYSRLGLVNQKATPQTVSVSGF